MGLGSGRVCPVSRMSHLGAEIAEADPCDLPPVGSGGIGEGGIWGDLEGSGGILLGPRRKTNRRGGAREEETSGRWAYRPMGL